MDCFGLYLLRYQIKWPWLSVCICSVTWRVNSRRITSLITTEKGTLQCFNKAQDINTAKSQPQILQCPNVKQQKQNKFWAVQDSGHWGFARRRWFLQILQIYDKILPIIITVYCKLRAKVLRPCETYNIVFSEQCHFSPGKAIL